MSDLILMAFLGFFIGFSLCIFAIQDYHKRIVDRGYMSVDDKVYIVKAKDMK